MITLVVIITLLVSCAAVLGGWFLGRYHLKRALREVEEKALRNECPICHRDLGDYIPFQPGCKMVWFPVDTYEVFKRVCRGCWHPNLEKEHNEKTKQ